MIEFGPTWIVEVKHWIYHPSFHGGWTLKPKTKLPPRRCRREGAVGSTGEVLPGQSRLGMLLLMVLMHGGVSSLLLGILSCLSLLRVAVLFAFRVHTWNTPFAFM